MEKCKAFELDAGRITHRDGLVENQAPLYARTYIREEDGDQDVGNVRNIGEGERRESSDGSQRMESRWLACGMPLTRSYRMIQNGFMSTHSKIQ